MADISSPTNPSSPIHPPRRARGRHSFYMSDAMYTVAHRLSEAEEARTGCRVGAGQIIDRAMRRYVADILTPEELAALVQSQG